MSYLFLSCTEKKIIFIQITLKLGNQAHCLKLGVGRGFSKNAKQ